MPSTDTVSVRSPRSTVAVVAGGAVAEGVAGPALPPPVMVTAAVPARIAVTAIPAAGNPGRRIRITVHLRASGSVAPGTADL
ncbi:hypothetical protein GCM10009677_52800 [Sphaerisporangium rubeum]